VLWLARARLEAKFSLGATRARRSCEEKRHAFRSMRRTTATFGTRSLVSVRPSASRPIPVGAKPLLRRPAPRLVRGEIKRPPAETQGRPTRQPAAVRHRNRAATWYMGFLVIPSEKAIAPHYSLTLVILCIWQCIAGINSLITHADVHGLAGGIVLSLSLSLSLSLALPRSLPWAFHRLHPLRLERFISCAQFTHANAGIVVRENKFLAMSLQIESCYTCCAANRYLRATQ